jgi:hypothetical protein
VTSTVKELVAGSPFDFIDRGIHQLKGVDDWHLFSAREMRPVRWHSQRRSEAVEARLAWASVREVTRPDRAYAALGYHL